MGGTDSLRQAGVSTQDFAHCEMKASRPADSGGFVGAGAYQGGPRPTAHAAVDGNYCFSGSTDSNLESEECVM